MTQVYSFPILADHELLPCAKEMDLPLSAASLAKPTPEVVRPVYESVITTLMGVTRSPPPPSADSHASTSCSIHLNLQPLLAPHGSTG